MHGRRRDRRREQARADREQRRGETGTGLVDAGDAEAREVQPVDERRLLDP
jgi:hypothetical protein